MSTLIFFIEVIAIAIAFWQVNAIAGIAEMKGYSKTALPKTIRIVGNTLVVITTLFYLFSGVFKNPLVLLIVSIIVGIIEIALAITLCVFFFITIYNKDKTNKYSEKSMKVDMTLCVFLGWVGAHRYYEKKYATAVIWTLTLGVFGIGYFVDYLSMLKGVRLDKNDKVIRRWNSLPEVKAYMDTLSDTDKELYMAINYEGKPETENQKKKFTLKGKTFADFFTPSLVVYIGFIVFFVVMGLILYIK
ncbi:MAG: TM2 domain-containing protein [Treponema sp.]|nr:TM2 domain-containing protein [Treponema sp.]